MSDAEKQRAFEGLRQLRDICKLTPLRDDELEALAVDRSDLDDVYRPDIQIDYGVRIRLDSLIG